MHSLSASHILCHSLIPEISHQPSSMCSNWLARLAQTWQVSQPIPFALRSDARCIRALMLTY